LRSPYPEKTFTIDASANPNLNPYIQDVKLNGQDHAQNWIPFKDISGGGELQFSLGATPNKSWGIGTKEAPPSLSEEQH
jgi:putative alpha-1,2-mannosidase